MAASTSASISVLAVSCITTRNARLFPPLPTFLPAAVRHGPRRLARRLPLHGAARGARDRGSPRHRDPLPAHLPRARDRGARPALRRRPRGRRGAHVHARQAHLPHRRPQRPPPRRRRARRGPHAPARQPTGRRGRRRRLTGHGRAARHRPPRGPRPRRAAPAASRPTATPTAAGRAAPSAQTYSRQWRYVATSPYAARRP